MPKKKPTRRRRALGEQPPHRGHGSGHAKRTKKRSQRAPKPLTTNSLAESLKERMDAHGGPKGPIEKMASDSIAKQDAARRALEQAQRRKRQEAQSNPHASRSVTLNPQDRALMQELVAALRENTQVMRQMMDTPAPEDDGPEDETPAEEQAVDGDEGEAPEADDAGEDEPEAASA